KATWSDAAIVSRRGAAVGEEHLLLAGPYAQLDPVMACDEVDPQCGTAVVSLVGGGVEKHQLLIGIETKAGGRQFQIDELRPVGAVVKRLLELLHFGVHFQRIADVRHGAAPPRTTA